MCSLSEWKLLAWERWSAAPRPLELPKHWKSSREVKAGWSEWHTWLNAQPGGLGILANNWQPAQYIWLRLLCSSHQAFLESWASIRFRKKKCIRVLNKIFNNIHLMWNPFAKNKNKKLGGEAGGKIHKNRFFFLGWRLWRSLLNHLWTVIFRSFDWFHRVPSIPGKKGQCEA